MKAKVIKEFIDLKNDGIKRHANEVFELTAARFDEINGIIPGYIELYEADPEPVEDVPTMENTKAEITAYLDAHGIAYDAKAKKVDLLALIG